MIFQRLDQLSDRQGLETSIARAGVEYGLGEPSHAGRSQLGELALYWPKGSYALVLLYTDDTAEPCEWEIEGRDITEMENGRLSVRTTTGFQ